MVASNALHGVPGPGPGVLTRLRHLEHVELFKDVPLSSLRYFLQRCKERSFEPGAVILSPCMRNDRLFLIIQGSVTVHLESLQAEPIAEMSAGECFGEMSAFDGTAPSAFIRAGAACNTIAIERDTLWAMINFSHGVARNMLALLARRLRMNNLTMSVVQRERDQHHEEANRDGLTGVYNRRWLESLIVEWGTPGGEMPGPVSVIMVDVDHFKHFNDTFGHAAGDAVLRQVAECLRSCLRPPDRVARFGGEEFVVLLPRTQRVVAARVAERLRECLAGHIMNHGQQELPPVTASFGVAQWCTGDDVQEVLAEADRALYRAKQAGRNQVATAGR